MNAAGLLAIADAAEALARVARAAADGSGQDDDALLPLSEAARIAATSVRVVRDAIRFHELPAYGRARDRAVRRGDVHAWIASRRVVPVRGADDEDIARRVRRLERNQRRREGRRASR
jgi:hypothetical protein